MTEPKFTPAPWFITANKLNVKNVNLDKLICFTSNETTYNESEANANLIAAAPDLYEALVGVLKLWDATIGSEEDAIKQARKAIAKARGET